MGGDGKPGDIIGTGLFVAKEEGQGMPQNHSMQTFGMVCKRFVCEWGWKRERPGHDGESFIKGIEHTNIEHT